MSAFFRNTTQEHTDKNARDPAPVLVLAQGRRRRPLAGDPAGTRGAAATVTGRRKELDPDFRAWAKTVEPDALASRLPGTVVSLPLDEGAGEEAHGFWGGAPQTLVLGEEPAWQAAKAGRALQLSPEIAPNLGDVAGFERDQPFTVSAWVFAPAGGKPNETIVARMDNDHAFRGWALEVANNDLQFYLVSKWPDDAILVERALQAQRMAARRRDLRRQRQGRRRAPVREWRRGEAEARAPAVKGSTVAQTPLRVGRRSTSNDFTGALQAVQILDRRAAPTEIRALMKASEARVAAAVAPERRDRDQTAALFDYFANSDPATAAASPSPFAWRPRRKRSRSGTRSR